MKFKIPLKRIVWPLILTVVLLSSLLFLAVVLQGSKLFASSFCWNFDNFGRVIDVSFASPSENTVISPRQKQQVSVGLPARLRIPKIRVDAAVDYVSLTSNGSMGLPKLPRNIAWYELGVRPGEIGTAALAGHVNWWNGATSVFANLNKLKAGDKIIVQDKNGVDISFVVNKIRMYGAKDDATEVFFSNDNKARISLITCGGTWNKITKSYSKRLVVFADKLTD